MSQLKIYGIPTCSTCTKALKWLDEQDVTYEFINTKVNPPSSSQLTAWVEQIGNKPLRNTSGQSYRALGPTKDTWGMLIGSGPLVPMPCY